MSIKETLKARREQEAQEATAMAEALAKAGIESVEVESEKENTMSEDTIVTVSEDGEILVNGSVQEAPASAAPSVPNTTAYLMETSPLRQTEAEVAVILAERGYRNYNEVVTVLDIMNPQLVILDGTTNASNVAMSWAKSRQREFKVMIPNWGDGPNQNPVAGVERNREVIKFATKLINEHADRVVVLEFKTGERDDQGRLTTFDTAVASFEQILNEKNEMLAAAPVQYHKFRIPFVDVKQWLVQDAICAGAQYEVYEGVFIDIPEPKQRIGVREVVTNNPNW